MKVKRFHGATSREVLRKVREALGENAIILSNRNAPSGVEILAVAEEDMAVIVAPATPAPKAPEPEKQIEVRSLLRRDGRFFGRSRSGRRAQHAVPAVALEEELPEPEQQPEESAPLSTQDFLQERSEAVRSPIPDANEALVAEMKSMRAAFQAQIESLVRAADVQKALAERSLATENARLVEEIGTLRSLVERELTDLAWNDTARRRPACAEVIRRCLRAGFSATLARELADEAPAEADERALLRWLSSELEQRLAVAPAERIIERGGVYALVGPTGVGKTTTTAKLAARCAMKFGASRLALITMDGYRIGAHEQLRTYGRILGVPVHALHDAAALPEVLASLTDKHLILIDTAGLAQRDTRVGEQIEHLISNEVQRLLVLNAAAQPDTLEEVVEVYRGPSLAGCLLTKADEAVKLGSVLDVVLRHRLEVHYVANGQRVPEDLHAPHLQYLVHRALRVGGAEAFALQEDEIGLAVSAAHAPLADLQLAR